MFQFASITKWPKTGTFTLHMFGYCTDKNFITTEVNVYIDRETSLTFKIFLFCILFLHLISRLFIRYCYIFHIIYYVIDESV